MVRREAENCSRPVTFFRMFFRFCVDREGLTRNPARPLKPPKIRDHPRVPPTAEEMTAIICLEPEFLPPRPRHNVFDDNRMFDRAEPFHPYERVSQSVIPA